MCLLGNVCVCVCGQLEQLRAEPRPAGMCRPSGVPRDGRVDLIHGGSIPIRHVRIRRHCESLENQTKAKHVPALEESFCGLLGDCSVLAVQQQKVQNPGRIVNLGMGRQAASCSSSY